MSMSPQSKRTNAFCRILAILLLATTISATPVRMTDLHEGTVEAGSGFNLATNVQALHLFNSTMVAFESPTSPGVVDSTSAGSSNPIVSATSSQASATEATPSPVLTATMSPRLIAEALAKRGENVVHPRRDSKDEAESSPSPSESQLESQGSSNMSDDGNTDDSVAGKPRRLHHWRNPDLGGLLGILL